MNQARKSSPFLSHHVAAVIVTLSLSGCAVYESPRPYPPPDRASYYDDAPVYEPAPREAVAVYERDLSPYGRWVEVRDYGRCWVPADRPRGWRPYTVGHWVDTDAGWCWVSEDREAEWGFVTYHYGRWFEDPSYGWAWAPGTTWAPAWVAWRAGDGYCGWAPLPPRVGYGVNVSVAVVDRYVPADRYTYCEERYLGEPRIYERVIRGDTTIIRRTTNITNITIVNNRVENRGVPVDQVERSSGRRVERVRVAEAASPAEVRRLHTQGLPVAYVPPAIQTADTDYRQRLERRQVDARADERARADRRVTDADIARQQERDRAARRAQDEQQAAQSRTARPAPDARIARPPEATRAPRPTADEAARTAAERQAADRAAQSAPPETPPVKHTRTRTDDRTDTPPASGR